MAILFVTKDKKTGMLVYASGDLNFVIKKTEEYFATLSEKKEFTVDTVVNIEPIKNNN